MEECCFNSARVTRVFEDTFASRTEAIHEVVRRTMEFIRRMPCAKEHFHEVELALTEGLANAVIHGNRRDPSKKVHISVDCANDEQLLIAITDEGEGFDPAALPDPTLAENIFSDHGRGVYLINFLMDQAEYRMGGRQVLMRKRVGT